MFNFFMGAVIGGVVGFVICAILCIGDDYDDDEYDYDE